MAVNSHSATSSQFYLPPSPLTSPASTHLLSSSTSNLVGDGFTSSEIHDALLPPTPASSTSTIMSWCPSQTYIETAIADLQPGAGPVTFLGRVANIYDIAHSPKTDRAARGCVKVCVKDDEGAVTVRQVACSETNGSQLICVIRMKRYKLANGVVVSNGEHGNLASTSAPLFTSIFPERDPNGHLKVYECEHDDRTMFRRPLGYEPGQPLHDLMTLRNFIDGGHEVVGARIMVVVKKIDAPKQVIQENGRPIHSVKVSVQDDTAQAVLGLWGAVALSSGALNPESNLQHGDAGDLLDERPWKPNETILLLQSSKFKSGSTTYITLTSSSIIDINPDIPETTSLRRWSKRQQLRENINPPFPQNSIAFSLRHLTTSPLRPLYTLAELAEVGRESQSSMTANTHHGPLSNPASYQGYLSLIITRLHLLECSMQNCLFAAQCCDNPPIYTNNNDLFVSAAPHLTRHPTQCPSCFNPVSLRLNPRILGAAIDETADVARGHFVLHDSAWRDLLQYENSSDVSLWSREELLAWEAQWRFRRVIVAFGWTADETVVGGRICILGIDAKF